VPDDSSLTDFTADDVEAESASDDGDAEPASDDSDAEPATVTYEWSDDGTACADCGEPTPRRWRDDGSFVCAACKDW